MLQIWEGLAEIPAGQASVVTIGVFDGLHRGHQKLIERTVRRAQEQNLPAVVVTFDPHPLTLHRPDLRVQLITSVADRLDGMEAMGVDATLVEPYCAELAAQTAEEFVYRYFVEALGVQLLVVGEDVRLGRKNAGDASLLVELGKKWGFEVEVVTDICSPEGRRWSSTWVREALLDGDVAEAARVLGRHHRLRGEVVHGFKRGRALGFPTANLAANGIGVVPADGVYAGWLVRWVGEHGTEHLPAAISVGTNPQFSAENRTVEAHVLGRADLDLYGQEIAIDFVERLRPMQKFESLDALTSQMDEDLRRTARVLRVPVSGRVDPALVTAE